MSKKHFEQLAAALKWVRPSVINYGKKPTKAYRTAIEVWQACVIGVANVCSANNSNFDRQRFYSACGYEDN